MLGEHTVPLLQEILEIDDAGIEELRSVGAIK
jgi:hypothetical protein